jgi:hypothetical protein
VGNDGGGEAFHQRGRDPQFHRGAHQGVGHAVIVALELDVVVNVDPGRLPAKDLKPLGGQYSQGRTVQLLKGAAPIARQLLEGTLVQIDQQQGNRPVELDQAEELAVAQPGQNPALDDQYGVLYLGLVPGVSRTCCQEGATVVGGKFVIQTVGLRVIGVRVLDQCTGLVRHDQAWHPAEEFQCLNLRANPVGRRLPGSRTGVGVVGGYQNCWIWTRAPGSSDDKWLESLLAFIVLYEATIHSAIPERTNEVP